MKIKFFIWPILLLINLFFINSCQKDDNTDGMKEVDICPEVAMGNFDEVGMIIKDYLSNQNSHSQTENLESLDKYLNKCSCLITFIKNSSVIKEYPGIMEYQLNFISNSDTIVKIMDLQVFENGRIEFRKFHN